MSNNKITIIGAGMVGSTAAFSLLADQVADEIVLIDIDKKLAKSQAMDLQHSMPFWGFTKIKAGTYSDIRDSKIVIVTCGVSQKPGETRIDLIKKNSEIIKEIMPKIFEQNKDVIVLMVTNPVDILTYIAIKMFPGKKNQIIGSGTILDSARFRFLIGDYLKINPKSIHAYIVGEHGDSEVPLWSTATIGNTPIDNFKKITQAEKDRIFNSAKNAAYAIIAGKQSTYYAIAAGVSQLSKAILFDHRTVLPVSHLINGEFGIKDVCFSLPVIVGRKGVVERMPLNISKDEEEQLKISATELKLAYKKL